MGQSDFRSVYLPYCLKKVADNEYIVLNRNYKPLGYNIEEFLDYGKFPTITFKKLTEATLKKLSWNESSSDEEIFLYADSCIPTYSKGNMDLYSRKLELLDKLKIVES
jgi:hypothetical protein